jgi:mono/diheme cytochrome c family protein
MKSLRFLSLLLPCLSAAPAFAAGDAVDVSRGHALATAWCARCHAVERGQLRSPQVDVPSFAAVGGDRRITETAIRVYLRSNHPSMPDVKLTQAETDDIVDYLLSLRP